MSLRSSVFAAAFAFGAAAGSATAAPIGVNGAIGAEWAGVTPEVVTFDVNAPQSNFGAPGTTNHVSAYNVLFRADSTYIYVGLQAFGGQDVSAVNFANLYFGLAQAGPTFGGSVGFEVTNQRAFRPGIATGGPNNDGYYPYNPIANDIHYAATTGVIEFAAPITFFTGDPFGTGFTAATTAIRLSLSQSFGYSVAGGNVYGVPDRLGIVFLDAPTQAPEPASLALLATAAAGLAMARRRRR